MGHLIKGRDAGGLRYFLDDKPVHAGTGLELRLPGDPGGAIAVRQLAARYVTDGPHRHLLEQAAADIGERWVHVRFESSRGEPLLYLPLGGPWETWRPPAGQHVGDEVQVACETCDGSGRRQVGDRCERCGGTGERGGFIGDPDKRVSCDQARGVVPDTGAPGGENVVTLPRAAVGTQCAHGVVARARACEDCDGTGKRWRIVEPPSPVQVVLRGDGLTRAELRWPRGSR
jgi:hypothetical protein